MEGILLSTVLHVSLPDMVGVVSTDSGYSTAKEMTVAYIGSMSMTPLVP